MILKIKLNSFYKISNTNFIKNGYQDGYQDGYQ
jgi:hypothetical protein